MNHLKHKPEKNSFSSFFFSYCPWCIPSSSSLIRKLGPVIRLQLLPRSRSSSRDISIDWVPDILPRALTMLRRFPSVPKNNAVALGTLSQEQTPWQSNQDASTKQNKSIILCWFEKKSTLICPWYVNYGPAVLYSVRNRRIWTISLSLLGAAHVSGSSDHTQVQSPVLTLTIFS